MRLIPSLIFVFFHLPLFAFAQPSTESSKFTEIRIQLNWKAEPQFGGFYAAQLSKTDASEGLAFDLKTGGSGTPTIQLLVNEKVDFAVVSAEEILISNEKNPKNPVVAVFATYQNNPQMIMCHESLAVDSLKKLFESENTLSWQNGLSYAQFLKNKFPKSKLKFVPYNGGIGAFINNKSLCQQGFVTSEPLLATKAGVSPKIFLVSDEGFNPYTTVLAVRKKYLNQKESQVKRVVTALRGGWVSYLGNPTATNSKLTQLNPAMDLRTAQESAKAQEKLIRPDAKFKVGSMTNSRWSTLIQQMEDLKLIRKGQSAADQWKEF